MKKRIKGIETRLLVRRNGYIALKVRRLKYRISNLWHSSYAKERMEGIPIYLNQSIFAEKAARLDDFGDIFRSIVSDCPQVDDVIKDNILVRLPMTIKPIL
mmetsp:Transcript_32331/g.52231  ORF Transcript_32331/g.52231 Transcript_32331/m.52231 type:complete len:101 (+) Transcript_32331:244-546(+)